jgi:hypothetical protein
MESRTSLQSPSDFVPPHPGSSQMPRWDAGELPAPPEFRWRNWTAMLGPGLVMGAAAIGGGEWLTGPVVTARYGGALFWLATLSILAQTIYNVEISRYTLYCGEPIFTGKFRTLPGPLFWVFLYLLLDFGSFMPYLAANATIPLMTLYLGKVPDFSANPDQKSLATTLSCVLFLLLLVPLLVGGKVYNSMKAVMTFKLVYVLGLLMFLAVCFSSPSVWENLIMGFVKFGNVPVSPPEDLNKDGKQDPDEAPHSPNVDNIFVALWQGRSFPKIDMSVISFLMAMAAISGNGGLTNTPISSYTRDQGWGMGKHVGAIPSVVGGHAIELSHVGMVFPVTNESLRRWYGWVKHVAREQWCVWMPACFVGLAMPSMLSLVFLPPHTVLADKDKYMAAAMTAEGVSTKVAGLFGTPIGQAFWFLTLFCGVLVLATSMAATADGVLRRWIDVFWTGLPMLRKWEARHIGRLYFGTLIGYAAIGLVLLTLVDATKLLTWSTTIYNAALGFSCFHVLVINTTLLPRELRPGGLIRLGLVCGGLFFMTISIFSLLTQLQILK